MNELSITYGQSARNRHSRSGFGRMAFSFLGLFYLASFNLSALAAPSNQVQLDVNPTTGYFESKPSTIRTPPNVQYSPVRDISPNVVERLPNGAFGQKISGGIEITALKQSVPLSARVRVGANALKGAAARCLTSMRCNLAFFAGSVGLEQLFDGLDWVMGEGAQIQREEVIPTPGPQGFCRTSSFATCGSTPTEFCQAYFNWGWGVGHATATTGTLLHISYSNWDKAFVGRVRCQGFNYVATPIDQEVTAYSSAYSEEYNNSVVSEDDILSGLTNYNPDPSDFSFLTGGIDLSHPEVDIEITSAPTLETPPTTKTIYDADGNPIEIQETNIWHDFKPKDNPSKQPSVDVETTEETTTYDGKGNKTSSSTKSSTSTASNSTSSTGSGSPSPEIPTDCDLMPSLCAWMEWTKEPAEKPTDELPQVEEKTITYVEKTLSAPEGYCPAPHQLQLHLFGITMSPEVSFQPFCDLAINLRGLYLSLCAFLSMLLIYRGVV